MAQFIAELKRRKVLKTMGVYAAAALIIIQVADIVFPRLLFPDWTVTFVIVLVILGFPITFFLSWTYDLKKDGVTQDNPGDEITAKKWSLTKKIIFPVTGFVLMIMGGLFWFVYPFFTIGTAHERDYDASIAILYMENMSSEENSYFADGLTEELINRLSRIQNLKVRPRTDVAVFKNKIVSIAKIAEELNVNYIVEGSVRIAGDNLRVNAQLFDIAKDNTVWSESYNNTLKDIFDVQDEIASKIVAKLDEKLTISKSDLIATERKATENLEAYNLVMKAFQHINNPIYTERKLGEIIEPIAAKAIKLDSTYADAYAISSLAIMFKYKESPTEENSDQRKREIKDRNLAKLHVKLALQHDPDNLLAMAIKSFLPIFTEDDEFDANKILIIRGMMVDVQMLLDKYPDNIFSQFVYAFFLFFKANIQGGEPEDYQEPLNRMLEIYIKFKKNDFVLSHPTEGIALSGIFEQIPQLYYITGKGEKSLEFIKDNKQNFCANGTYDCLNTEILTQIESGFYSGLDYENALEINNLILSQSEEELLAVGNNITDKIQPYYKSGMIYMKWGQYEKAIEGFTQAINLSLENESDNQWWNAHYYRRLGLVYFYKDDYVNASKNYLESCRLNETLDDMKKFSIKALCSYGYVEQLLGHQDTAKEKMMECSNWVLENNNELKNDHDTYETIWPLYLYHTNIEQQEKASKYLKMAYDNIENKLIQQYHEHNERDIHPRFFYCRDFIKAYETSSNQ